MKKIILTICIFFLCINLRGQSNPVRFGFYSWSYAVLMKPVNVNGQPINKSMILSEIGQRFNVVDVVGDSVMIHILDYTTDNSNRVGFMYAPKDKFFRFNFSGDTIQYQSLSNSDANSRSYGSFQMYFKVSINVLESAALNLSKVGCSLAAGIINFPFKYRFSPTGYTDFSGTFNFGGALGVTLAHKTYRKFTNSILIGFSISNIILDSTVVRRNYKDIQSINNFSSFSGSIGYLVEYDKVQAGIFLGFDKLSNINQRRFGWRYQGKPWVSIGFGYAIFTRENSNVSTNKSDKAPNK